MASGDLRAQVTLALSRRADIIQQQRQNIALHYAVGHQLHRRDANAFLIDLFAESHRPGVSSADVGMMGARGDVEIRATCLRPALRTSCEYWRHQRDIGKMSAPAKGIVED